MGKLIKYEVRRLVPFLLLFSLNLLWLLFNFINPEGNVNKGLQSIIELGNFFIILYSIKAFNDELDEEKSILSYQLPVSTFHRVIVKHSLFCIAYGLIIVLNVVVTLCNKENIYSVMYNELKNSNQYIIYVIVSRIFGYVSGMAVAIFIILISKKISKKFAIYTYKETVSIVLGIGTFIISIAIWQNLRKYSFLTDKFIFQPVIKSGIDYVRYQFNEYVLFFSSSLSGSINGIPSGSLTNLIHPIDILPTIINAIIIFISIPFIWGLCKNE